MNKQRIFILAAGGIGLLSCFMTWATVGLSIFKVPLSGVQSGWGGKLALLGFIATIVFALLGNREQPVEPDKKKYILIGGFVALIMSILAMIGMSVQDGSEYITFGLGMYLALLAAIAVVAIPFVIKENGDFSMPTKDELVNELNEIKDDIVDDVKEVKEKVEDKFDKKED